MTNEEKKSAGSSSAIMRAAGVVAANTFLSRVLGVLRESVIASVFGAGAFTDAFFTAFKLPNMLRNLLGEGSLTKSFIPQFARAEIEGREHAEALAAIVYTFLLLLLSLITIAVFFGAKYLVYVIAPGFAQDPEKFALTVSLTRLIFPYCFFIILVALAQGILNSYKHFFAPAFSPALMNILIIAAALGLTPLMPAGREVYSLAIGVLVAGVVQLIFQIPFLRRYGTFFRISFDFKNPRARAVGRLFAPTLFSSGIYYINILITNALASLMAGPAVSYLFWAGRFFEFPLSISGSPLNTAVFPYIAESAAAGDTKKLAENISFGLRLVVIVSLPAIAFLLIAAKPMINLALQRGKFDASDCTETSAALVAFSLGLFFYSFRNVLINVFFSLEDSREPVRSAFFQLAVFIGAAIAFMKFTALEHVGLAAASSLGAGAAALYLVLRLVARPEGSASLFENLPSTFIKSAVASSLMAAPAYYLFNIGYVDWSLPADLANGGQTAVKVGIFSGALLICAVVYWIGARTLKISEIEILEQYAKRAAGKIFRARAR